MYHGIFRNLEIWKFDKFDKFLGSEFRQTHISENLIKNFEKGYYNIL